MTAGKAIPGLALTVNLVWAAVAGAVLTPSNASQVVTLRSNPFNTCDSGLGEVFDRRVAADGTSSAFSIPAGQVLVITDWSYSVITNSTANAGTSDVALLGVVGGTVIASSPFEFDSAGNAGKTEQVTAVMKSGHQLCLSVFNGGGDYFAFSPNILHGFLAPDR